MWHRGGERSLQEDGEERSKGESKALSPREQLVYIVTGEHRVPGGMSLRWRWGNTWNVAEGRITNDRESGYEMVMDR